MTHTHTPAKFLIIQHQDATTPGSSTRWLQKNNLPFEIIRIDKSSSLPDLKMPISGVIICGGTQNVDQESEFPWLINEKAFIKKCLLAKIPLLGLCLGAQLVAEVLQASVVKAEKWEYGWQEVYFHPELKTHPIWKNLFSESKKVFQAHGYRFELPKGYTPLASSPACTFQGFLSDHVLAFQFHPEVDSTWIAQSLDGYVPIGEFCQTRQEIENDNPGFLEKNENWYFKILDLFFLNKTESLH